MSLAIIIVLLLLSLGGAGWGHRRYGLVGWSPGGILRLVLVVLWATGRLH